jgi:hypothetical protein
VRAGKPAAAALTVLASIGVIGPVVVSAQVPEDYAADLESFDVIYDEGAPGIPSDDAPQLAALDDEVAEVQEDGAYFKVIVLAEPVTRFDTEEEFAEAVLDELGGDGRLLVYGIEDVAIASTVDDAGEIDDAEIAAIDATTTEQSYAAGVDAAADALGVQGGGGGGVGADGGGGSGIWIFLIFALLALGGFLLYRWMKKKSAGAGAPSGVSLGEGERKVRASVDRAGNLILDLADRVEDPGAPPQAKEEFQTGAQEFADLQDELEAADTHGELEAVYPRIVNAVWRLETAQALVEGRDAPPEPTPEPLFPPMPAPAMVPGPGTEMGGSVAVGPPADAGQGYRGFNVSPWLTTAATAALSMLASRAMAPPRSHYRPPADDSWFGDTFGSGGRSRSSRRSGGGRIGGGWSRGGGRSSSRSRRRRR